MMIMIPVWDHHDHHMRKHILPFLTKASLQLLSSSENRLNQRNSYLRLVYSQFLNTTSSFILILTADKFHIRIPSRNKSTWERLRIIQLQVQPSRTVLLIPLMAFLSARGVVSLFTPIRHWGRSSTFKSPAGKGTRRSSIIIKLRESLHVHLTAGGADSNENKSVDNGAL